MRYKKFIIENYRAIRSPIEIDLPRNSLLPIIGVNECGKTTILHALLAFDYSSDELNSEGRHLQDVRNLYDSDPKDPTVSAEIVLTKDELTEFIQTLSKEDEWEGNQAIKRYQRSRASFDGL